MTTPASATAPALRAVIFDLDGTLVDSAGEIHVALGRTLGELRLPSVSLEDTQSMIGKGVRVLVERALAKVGGPEGRLDEAVARFEAHYEKTVGTAAMLFPGVRRGIERLHASAIPMGVVTNKPRHFTLELLVRLGVAPYLAATVAGDDGIPKKPRGDMLVEACRQMGTPPAATLMLGDSDNDIIAARNAGCPVWCVPYGYNEGKRPEELACDRLVKDVEEAASLILGGTLR